MSATKYQTSDDSATAGGMQDFQPKIIGLYGVSGAGKTSLMNHIRTMFRQNSGLKDVDFNFVDGSKAITTLLPPVHQANPMAAFNQLSAEEQDSMRATAIENIRKECVSKRAHGLVAGHYMFWGQSNAGPGTIWTEKDAQVYTHMLYLHVDPADIQRRRQNDQNKKRPSVTIEHLAKWQEAEMRGLREACYENSIPFAVIRSADQAVELVAEFVRRNDFAAFESQALSQVQAYFSQPSKRRIDTALVFDADKTLSTQDAGEIFCNLVDGCDGALNEIFSSGLGYKPEAFYQAMLMFEGALGAGEWENVCEKIAQQITIHMEFVELLQAAAKKDNIGIVVVTCGIGKVWQKVLQKHGFGDAVHVVGGGRLKDGVIVTPTVKARIVEYLQSEKNALTWAFGDSQLDLPMLQQADNAIVVVGHGATGSKSMEGKLATAIKEHGLLARQLLLPSSVKPRLATHLLPIIHPAALISEIPLTHPLKLLHATNHPAQKLLTTPTRTSAITGLALQAAHRRIGFYLATALLPALTGLEKTPITSVQETQSAGHRVRHESRTVIVSCMRGGDPLAQGVFEALPCATYVHAAAPADLRNAKHVSAIRDAKTILLCDFVINNGKTMVEMVREIRGRLNEARGS